MIEEKKKGINVLIHLTIIIIITNNTRPLWHCHQNKVLFSLKWCGPWPLDWCNAVAKINVVFALPAVTAGQRIFTSVLILQPRKLTGTCPFSQARERTGNRGRLCIMPPTLQRTYVCSILCEPETVINIWWKQSEWQRSCTNRHIIVGISDAVEPIKKKTMTKHTFFFLFCKTSWFFLVLCICMF